MGIILIFTNEPTNMSVGCIEKQTHKGYLILASTDNYHSRNESLAVYRAIVSFVKTHCSKIDTDNQKTLITSPKNY
ncbi:hypothetical protein T4B_8537 [Trichinella pseudospiralis]|uniref:Uncharacterized protein n=1 Tax=Trichinella pseudospiralis TaxID=6337 RepID=A0A0V1JF32_TRIPS|nr:hypothetical protein T4B_8537 [Trichinella pseudospiralis]